MDTSSVRCACVVVNDGRTACVADGWVGGWVSGPGRATDAGRTYLGQKRLAATIRCLAVVEVSRAHA